MTEFERRINNEQYDPAYLLTVAGLAFVGVLIVFVAAIIVVQLAIKGVSNTESWAALTGLIGWATSQVSIIYSNRYGTTRGAATKDAVIAQQARTASDVAKVAIPATAPAQPAGDDEKEPA